jgi:hypothetical protein
MMTTHQISQLRNKVIRVICPSGENTGSHKGTLRTVEHTEPLKGTTFVIEAKLQHGDGKIVVIRLRKGDVGGLCRTPQSDPLGFYWDGVIHPEHPVRRNELVDVR